MTSPQSPLQTEESAYTPEVDPFRTYRWVMLALLFCAYFLHQADRAIFSVLLPEIKAELKLTDTQLGMTSSILFLTTAIMVPIAGIVGDYLSRKKIITFSLIFWSLATMITGRARGLFDLILFRSVATGGGESFYGPSSTALIAAYHQKTRAFALSIHQAALYIGIMFSGFIAGYIAESYGWRSAFYVFGACGVLLGMIFLFLLKDPPKNEKTAMPAIPLKEALRTLLQIPTLWLLTVGFTAIVFVNNAFLTWAPKYIMESFKLDLTQAGGYTMLYHHLAALIGVLIGGSIADKMVRSFPRFRLILQATMMFLGAPLIFTMGLVSEEVNMMWITIFLFGGVRGLYESNTHAAVFEVVPPQLRSTVVSLMIMVAFLIGSLSPMLLGWLSDLHGAQQGLALGFKILSSSWLIGGFCVLTALLFTFKRDKIKE